MKAAFEFHLGIGLDEVGRGCLAGPVYSAAVKLRVDRKWNHYADSKLLSEQTREELFLDIQENHFCSIGLATCEEIDQINILQASLLSMHRALLAGPFRKPEVWNLENNHNEVFVDGNQKIKNLVDYKQTTLIKGDQRHAAIAAASILAKVTRDRVMQELDGQYPGYGFSVHKGYATLQHRQALILKGPSVQHRKTFRGVCDVTSNGPGREI